MLTFEQATVERRAELARQDVEVARLRRQRRDGARRRAAARLRGLAERIEPSRPELSMCSGGSGRPELAHPRA